MLKGFFVLIRPLNCLITFLVIIASGLICLNNNHISFTLLLGGLVGFLITAAGNTVNDINDIDIDRINRPQRPLPSLKLTINQAWILFVLLVVFSLLLSFFINQFAFLITLLSIALLILYSITLKKILLFGNVVISFLTAYAFIFGGIVVGNVKDAIIPAMFAFLINLIREVVKDMEDIEGDKIAGVNTFPIKYGSKASKYLVTAVSSVLFLFTFVPFLFQVYEIEFFIIVMLIVNPILVYFIKSLFEDSSRKNLGRLSTLLKMNMIFGLIAIFVGR
jgi:geranylgeranylglycerol-phosphate geranylgeranyltransferase